MFYWHCVSTAHPPYLGPKVFKRNDLSPDLGLDSGQIRSNEKARLMPGFSFIFWFNYIGAVNRLRMHIVSGVSRINSSAEPSDSSANDDDTLSAGSHCRPPDFICSGLGGPPRVTRNTPAVVCLEPLPAQRNASCRQKSHLSLTRRKALPKNPQKAASC